jgi:hypothetical protein
MSVPDMQGGGPRRQRAYGRAIDERCIARFLLG